MMPGPNIPPGVPIDPSRRQAGYQYHLPAQTHSPVQNPYYVPPHHGHHAPYYPPPFYYPQIAHHHYPQHPAPRPYMPIPPPMPQAQHQGPVIVSSNPHSQQAPNMATPRREKSPSADQHAVRYDPTHQQPVQEFRPQAAVPIATMSYPPPPTSRTGSMSSTQQAHTVPLSSPISPHVVHTPQPPSSGLSAAASATSTPAPMRVPSSEPPIPTPAPQPTRYVPKYPKLPWFSVPDQPFPPKAGGIRRRRRRADRSSIPLILPNLDLSQEESDKATVTQQRPDSDQATVRQAAPIVGAVEQEQRRPVQAVSSDLETPITSQAPSEADSTHPTTPSSAVPQQATPRQAAHSRTATKPVIPAVPIKVAVPNISPSQKKAPIPAPFATEKADGTSVAVQSNLSPSTETAKASPSLDTSTSTTIPASPPVKQPPSSWAALFQSKKPAAVAPAASAVVPMNGAASAKSTSLADVIRSYSVDSDSKIAFIEPRGLHNTGNMCYMNSILQILVFCIPFYEFLDQVGKRAVHSFKSETPLLDAMITFMREYRVIDSATSLDQLRMRLKDNELEQYGENLTPEYVYEVIRRLPRFSSMRRGHQQDAEEFLGFLLAGLHDECAQVLGSLPGSSEIVEVTSPTSQSSTSGGDGWMEVGPKQKAAVTRTSGHVDSDSPITKIFGGQLRSEFRVSGSKTSVTLEPYQPLQLDIGAPNINNIVDALKGLTKPEAIHGDFKSARGSSTSATKQVFIETLPPVLILHLKRFQYDNTGGTQKIWKKVGYPLELEIPKEVFPASKRNKFTLSGTSPKYRLTSVVYHHGKSAAGGHYTVDVRRQEGREWIRLDDTNIRRVRSEEVAEGGAEEDPKALAAALENHRDELKSGNIFDRFEDGEQERDEGGDWSQVNGSVTVQPGKKWSAVANGANTAGTSTPNTKGERTPKGKMETGGKVAYILIYQQIK